MTNLSFEINPPLAGRWRSILGINMNNFQPRSAVNSSPEIAALMAISRAFLKAPFKNLGTLFITHGRVWKVCAKSTWSSVVNAPRKTMAPGTPTSHSSSGSLGTASVPARLCLKGWWSTKVLQHELWSRANIRVHHGKTKVWNRPSAKPRGWSRRVPQCVWR